MPRTGYFLGVALFFLDFMLNETRIKTTAKTILLLLLVLFYCGVCLLPFIPVNLARLGQVVTTMLFLVLALFMSKSRVQKRICFGILSYCCLILFYWWIGYSSASSGNYFFQITFFVPFFIVIYIFKKIPYNHLFVIFSIVVILIIIHAMIDTVMGAMLEDLPGEELEKMGFSTTSTNTAALIVLSVLLILFFNIKPFVYRIICLSFIVFLFYYIVYIGQRGSVTIYLLLSIFFIIYQRRTHRFRASSGVRVIPIFILLFLMWVFRDVFFSFLIQISPSERLTERIVDLQGTFDNGVSEDSFSGRLSLEIISIKSWLSNIITFFFGIGDHRLEGDFGVEGFALSGIGGHSEFIDALARYGIIGFSLLVYIYVNIFKYILGLFSAPIIRKQVKALLIIVVLIGITKVLSFPDIGIVLFLLLPLSSVFLNKQIRIT